MNYYCVYNGKSPGIYNTWKECKEQIHGYKGAKYKKVDNLTQAKKYLKYSPEQDYSNKISKYI